MPRFDNDDMIIMNTSGPGTFQFSTVKPEILGASEYTIVCNVIDCSGSIVRFIDQINEVSKKIIMACNKSPRADNLLMRTITFNSKIEEIHGYKELHQIDVNNYPKFTAGGMTCLYDAVYNGIGSVIDLAHSLTKQDYSVNGAVYIITDGMDNCSKLRADAIKTINDEALNGEKIESNQTVLIAIKDPNITDADWYNNVSVELKQFANNAGINHFIDIGATTESNLAKIPGFISQSIMSQSQSLGTGSVSQPVNFTF